MVFIDNYNNVVIVMMHLFGLFGKKFLSVSIFVSNDLDAVVDRQWHQLKLLIVPV